MLRGGTNVDLDPVAVLACAGSDLRAALWLPDWHVVVRVHHGRTVDRRAYLPGRGRGRAGRVLHGGARDPACEHARRGAARAVVLRPQLHPARHQKFTGQSQESRQQAPVLRHQLQEWKLHRLPTRLFPMESRRENDSRGCTAAWIDPWRFTWTY